MNICTAKMSGPARPLARSKASRWSGPFAVFLRIICGAGFVAITYSGCFAQELENKRNHSANELQQLQQQITLKESRKKELADEIAKLENDRASINRELINTSAKTRELEQRIDESGKRLQTLLHNETNIRGSLKGRRKLLIEVLASLERMGRRPPPAILVKPNEALSSVRSAILLGSVVPEIRQETEVLVTELTSLVNIRKEAENEGRKLGADRQKLAEEEERLNLLLAEKKENAGKARTELASESAHAAELAAKANNLGKLIASLENEIASARKAAEAAKMAEEERKRNDAQRIETARKEIENSQSSDSGRIAPAFAFSTLRNKLPRPVNGVEITRFGQTDNFGVPANGASIATRNNARVLAPADGWVVYAGPFRSYGQLLILNAGEDYHLVLAGMESIDVTLGQFVLTGEPVGQMGARRIATSDTVDIGSARPVLYVEFRKNGHSIDPDPWWAPQKGTQSTESKSNDT